MLSDLALNFPVRSSLFWQKGVNNISYLHWRARRIKKSSACYQVERSTQSACIVVNNGHEIKETNWGQRRWDNAKLNELQLPGSQTISKMNENEGHSSGRRISPKKIRLRRMRSDKVEVTKEEGRLWMFGFQSLGGVRVTCLLSFDSFCFASIFLSSSPSLPLHFHRNHGLCFVCSVHPHFPIKLILFYLVFYLLVVSQFISVCSFLSRKWYLVIFFVPSSLTIWNRLDLLLFLALIAVLLEQEEEVGDWRRRGRRRRSEGREWRRTWTNRRRRGRRRRRNRKFAVVRRHRQDENLIFRLIQEPCFPRARSRWAAFKKWTTLRSAFPEKFSPFSSATWLTLCLSLGSCSVLDCGSVSASSSCKLWCEDEKPV